jgi:hypothetical protein
MSFEPQPSSEKSVRLHRVVSISNVATIYFTEQGRYPFILPTTRRTGFLYLCAPVKGWPCYIPRYWVPFWSPAENLAPTVEVF